MMEIFFSERIGVKPGFQLDWPQLALPSSIPDTYRLLSVFSGIPMPPLEAMRRSGLAVCDDDGKRCFSLGLRRTLGELVDAGWIRWVNWTQPAHEDDLALPPGYVLTGMGEAQLSAYFALYGPVWPRA